jgi:hypothetical protein
MRENCADIMIIWSFSAKKAKVLPEGLNGINDIFLEAIQRTSGNFVRYNNMVTKRNTDE